VSARPASGRPQLLALLLTPLLLGGCSGLALLDALTPNTGYRLESAITYGAHPRQRLDLYRPEPPVARAPVVVFFYGGNWRQGERGQYRFVGQALSSRGMLVVIPDYRLYPQAGFPIFVEDGAQAVAWVLANLAEGTSAPVFLMGHSAGAHIAALLATDRHYLRDAGADPGQLAGFVGLAGPYDFLPLSSDYLRTLFGPPERYPLSQPVRFVAGGEPPALLLHGGDDTTVRPRNSLSLAERWAAAGGQVELQLYPDLGHAALLAALAPVARGLAPTLEAIVDFVRRRGAATEAARRRAAPAPG
jgi:acetyl esterase/lipase